MALDLDQPFSNAESIAEALRDAHAEGARLAAYDMRELINGIADEGGIMLNLPNPTTQQLRDALRRIDRALSA